MNVFASANGGGVQQRSGALLAPCVRSRFRHESELCVADEGTQSKSIVEQLPCSVRGCKSRQVMAIRAEN
eukprot:4397765-Pleurochrysis_carterae.AAC.2